MGRRKSAAHLNKHRVDFADAVAVFDDENALTMRDLLAGEEERWITIRKDWLGRVLVAVYTWRGDDIRLISARPATARERRQYEEGQ